MQLYSAAAAFFFLPLELILAKIARCGFDNIPLLCTFVAVGSSLLAALRLRSFLLFDFVLVLDNLFFFGRDLPAPSFLRSGHGSFLILLLIILLLDYFLNPRLLRRWGFILVFIDRLLLPARGSACLFWRRGLIFAFVVLLLGRLLTPSLLWSWRFFLIIAVGIFSLATTLLLGLLLRILIIVVLLALLLGDASAEARFARTVVLNVLKRSVVVREERRGSPCRQIVHCEPYKVCRCSSKADA